MKARARADAPAGGVAAGAGRPARDYLEVALLYGFGIVLFVASAAAVAVLRRLTRAAALAG